MCFGAQLWTLYFSPWRAGRTVALTNAEFDLLELFMQNPNIVLTRYQLSEHINKDNYTIKHSNIVDVHIKNLRKKLTLSDFIKNIRGLGYKIDRYYSV